MAGSGGSGGLGGPAIALWLPCLLFAHAFAIFWIVRTQLLTRRAGRNANKQASLNSQQNQQEDASSSQGDAADVESDGAQQQPQQPSHKSDVRPSHDVSVFEKAVSENKIDLTASVLVPMGSNSQPLSLKKTMSGTGGGPLEATVSEHLASEALTLEWQSIGCSYSVPGAPTKVVLQDVWGKANPGQMQALMGPSGAGKSTLMDILAQRKSLGNLTGSLLVNGQPAPASFIKQTSYVPQEDTFVATMTSQETLAFYGGVTLGGEKWNRRSRQERVQEVLAAVGLMHAADTLVGGTLPGGLNLRGLSGGERRRLSIASGILSAPSVLFLDEPTSGLDSFAALSVMGHLQHVAQATHQTVIATIHQPRSAIWEMFDKVSLLASGRLMFHGRCSDMIPWFQGLGYAYTKGSEPDWVLDLVATGFSKPAQLFGHTMRSMDDVEAAADAFKDHYTRVWHASSSPSASSNSKDSDSSSAFSSSKGKGKAAMMSRIALKLAGGKAAAAVAKADDVSVHSKPSSIIKGSLRDLQSSLSYPTSWWRQFTSLLGREFKSMTRNPFDVAARIFTFTYVALLFGLMSYNVELQGLDGFNSINNMLFTTVLIMLLMPYVGISLYTSDKQMFIGDASARRYRTSAYYAAKAVGNLPFNILASVLYCGIFYGMCGLRSGSLYFVKFTTVVTLLMLIAAQVLWLCAVLAPNFDVTFSLSIVWTSVQLLCSSFFLNFGQVWMQWLTQLRYISAAYFSLEALVLNEFSGRVADCSKGLESGLVDMLQAGLSSATPMQRTILNRLKEPQPGCTFRQDALVEPLGFSRPFAISAGVLFGYLAVLHVLTYLGLLLATRNERR